jgi:hypothetical protein
MINGEYWTKPVVKGNIPIVEKIYTDGQNLMEVNLSWIDAIRRTLNIKTPIKFDFPTVRTKTSRIIEICQFYKADKYLAAEEAPNKYLDVEMMKKVGIEFVPFNSEHRKSTFEMIQEFGIVKCQNILEYGKEQLLKRMEKSNEVITATV